LDFEEDVWAGSRADQQTGPIQRHDAGFVSGDQPEESGILSTRFQSSESLDQENDGHQFPGNAIPMPHGLIGPTDQAGQVQESTAQTGFRKWR
jgi:hypothetical protein